jgi:multiple sugar transport system permease protein
MPADTKPDPSPPGAALPAGPPSRRPTWTGRRGPRGGHTRKEARKGLMFALPFIIGFAIFTFAPMVASLYYSFTDFNILQSPEWTGLDNYREVFSDGRFYKSLVNTSYLTFIGVPLGLAFALATALLLNLRRAPLRGIARAVAYMPAIVPVVVVAYLFRWILNGRYGIVNRALDAVGLDGPNWLLNSAWTKPVVILIGLWAVGGTTVIYLAALRSVSTDLYEAAQLDGCGPIRRFWHVTWPGILPVTVFQLVVGLLLGLQNFAVPYLVASGDGGPGGANQVMGGPGESLLTYAVYLYRVAFGYFRMGYASALAWILFVIALLLTLAVLRLSRRAEDVG